MTAAAASATQDRSRLRRDLARAGRRRRLLAIGLVAPLFLFLLFSFIIPIGGLNVAGGKELLRTMLSKEAASNFAKTKLAPTIVKDTVPADGFGSTALVSQSKLLADAGNDVFTWNSFDLYGTNQDELVVWNSFLDGQLDVAAFTAALQQITDRVYNDPSVTKVVVK